MTSVRPGIRVMVKNIADTAQAIVKDMIAGSQVLSQEDLAKSRISICEKCSLFDNSRNTCQSCGCFIKAKVKLQSAKCPIGKW